MKRQIRHGVYETNSSSTHAICIAKDGYKLEKHIDFHVGEYGWEFEKYEDTDSKASYLLTAILFFEKEYADEKMSQLKNILDDNNITYTFPELQTKSYQNDGKNKYYYDIDGYIDHCGELKYWLDDLFSDSDKLLRYLFGKSMVVTGNDNSDDFDYYMYTNPDIYPHELKDKSKCYDIYEKGN